MRSPFARDDFEEFIGERYRTILEAIETLLIKERFDLPPQLRELDERIEAIELSLRQKINDGLSGDAALLPPHVSQKVDERLQAARKKNAAIDIDRFGMLLPRLEYCDLRELQDTVLSKILWPRFEGRFANRETLTAKFGQFAELRNGIRHSRTVDEITRKEGEASILWFEQTLGR